MQWHGSALVCRYADDFEDFLDGTGARAAEAQADALAEPLTAEDIHLLRSSLREWQPSPPTMLTEAAMVRRAATRQTESARLPFSLSQPPGCGLVAAARRWRLPIRRMRRRFRPYCPATIAQAQASLACIQRCARGSGSAAAQRPPRNGTGADAGGGMDSRPIDQLVGRLQAFTPHSTLHPRSPPALGAPPAVRRQRVVSASGGAFGRG